jgi:hypothetical protein
MGDRKCEYITAPPRKPVHKFMTMYLPPAKGQPVFFVNTNGLDFFHQNLAQRLDGQFNTEFWSKLVLQLSHSEPAIRHAVSAVSIIHRDVEASMTNPSGYTNADPAASKEWNQAMQLLSARIQAKPNSNLVPLVCCLLFTCVEFLKGNVDSAFVHVQSGFKILSTVRNRAAFAESPGLSPEDLIAIEEHIVPMFARLNALCSLFGRVTPPINTITDGSQTQMTNIADARQILYEAIDPSVRFIRSAGRRAEQFELTVNDFIDQVKLQNALESWRADFHELLIELNKEGKSPKKEPVNLLIMQYLVVHTWLMVCTTAEETAIDLYTPALQEIVNLGGEITMDRAANDTPPPLSFDMQMIGPLYYTAVKCRDPVIRRQALNLLKLAPRREGLWNAHHAYVTAKRIIEIEEKGLRNRSELPNESSRLRGVNLPSDEARIYNTSNMPGERRKFDGSIVPSPSMPGMIEVVFMTKPDGPLGPWKLFTEQIEL